MSACIYNYTHTIDTYAHTHTHTPTGMCSNVDEIMLSYVAEVLSGLGEEEEEETSFDVEQFSEMISAYVPEFATVER